MRLRSFAVAAALALPMCLASHLAAPPRAEAAVSVLITLEELVGLSKHVVVAEPVDRTSRWEELAGARRIVTYTRLRVVSMVDGPPSSELVVRTLGGAVDGIGQSVAGEAQLRIGKRALVFLAEGDGALVVAGMAQGHYPVVQKEKEPPRLAGSPDAGLLLPRRGPSISAREELVGATLEGAARAVARVRKARDASK